MLIAIWLIPASIIVLSFFYGALATYSVMRNLKDSVWNSVGLEHNHEHKDGPESQKLRSPNVALLIPLYKEDERSVRETFSSVVRQSYPIDRVSVYILLERGDLETYANVMKCLKVLADAKVRFYLYLNSEQRSTKARALNKVISKAKNLHEIFMILDGGDIVLDDHYIEKAVKLINEGYGIVAARVYRVGQGPLGKISYVDTFLWYNVSLPGLTKFAGLPLVSGEGLALTKGVLEAFGGIPEVLAEDAYLTILASVYGIRIGLIDSVIVEGAPSNLVNLVKQRVRWYRGHLQCLRDVVTKYGRKMSPLRLASLTILYLQPIAMTAPFLSLAILILSRIIDVPSFIVLLAEAEVASLILAASYLPIIMKLREVTALVIPLHWIFQGVLVLASILQPKNVWLRTSSRSYVHSEIEFLRCATVKVRAPTT